MAVFKPLLYKLTFVDSEKCLKLQMPFIFLLCYFVLKKNTQL